jgi:hypothetical protein
MTSMTAAITVKTLKQVILDYNYWGESESDSPLEIKRSRMTFDDKRILSLDGSMRRKQQPGSALPAERAIRTEALAEVFSPLVSSAVDELAEKISSFKAGDLSIEALQAPTESLEFYTQLYSVFGGLSEPKVHYVDAPNDPYVTMFITGNASDGEVVYAQSLLVQT